MLEAERRFCANEMAAWLAALSPVFFSVCTSLLLHWSLVLPPHLEAFKTVTFDLLSFTLTSAREVSKPLCENYVFRSEHFSDISLVPICWSGWLSEWSASIAHCQGQGTMSTYLLLAFVLTHNLICWLILSIWSSGNEDFLAVIAFCFFIGCAGVCLIVAVLCSVSLLIAGFSLISLAEISLDSCDLFLLALPCLDSPNKLFA